MRCSTATPKVRESDIQRAILARLAQIPEAYFWRQNTGAVRQGSRFIRFGVPGCADILGAVRGRFVAIECKTPDGRQSGAQRAFQMAVETAGGIYILARDVAETIARVESIR